MYAAPCLSEQDASAAFTEYHKTLTSRERMEAASELIDGPDPVALAAEQEARQAGWMQLDLEDEQPGTIIYVVSAGVGCSRLKLVVAQPLVRALDRCLDPNRTTESGVNPAVALFDSAEAAVATATDTAADASGRGLNYTWFELSTIAGSSEPHPIDSEEDCIHSDKSYPGAVAGGGADVAGDAAQFSYPWGLGYATNRRWIVTADNGCAGSLYPNDRIKRVDAATGATAVLAGGLPGFRNGNRAEAQFRHVAAIVVHDAEDLAFVADSANHAIRHVNLGSGEVGTTCGHGRAGALESPGGFRDGAAATALFRRPQGLAFDRKRRILFISDTDNHRVRALELEPGTVSTVAGSAVFGDLDGPARSVATFKHPMGLAFDPRSGVLYVADNYNHRIRYITPVSQQLGAATAADDRSVGTLAGSTRGFCDGDGDGAKFQYPEGAAIDSVHRVLYVSDNHNSAIRAVAALGHPAAGRVTTITGAVGRGLADGGPLMAMLNNPAGIAVDGVHGRLYVADQMNHRIRGITIPAAPGRSGDAEGNPAFASFAASLQTRLPSWAQQHSVGLVMGAAAFIAASCVVVAQCRSTSRALKRD